MFLQIQPANTTTGQSTLMIPWHSIVPLLTVSSGPTSPVSQLSPPLLAAPVSTINGPPIDIPDDENDAEVLHVPTEEDDDVFENETTDSGLDNSNNKRRSQSLSALQTNSKETNKVRHSFICFLNFSCQYSMCCFQFPSSCDCFRFVFPPFFLKFYIRHCTSYSYYLSLLFYLFILFFLSDKRTYSATNERFYDIFQKTQRPGTSTAPQPR